VTRYLVLLRGINVGGKNKVSMAELRDLLEEIGFNDVSTYIASGNAIVESEGSAREAEELIEDVLPKRFKLDSQMIKVRAITRSQLRAVIDERPAGFGSNPGKYHSDVIFLMGIGAREAMSVFDPRKGVDKIWPGNGVVYSQRLSAERTKSRLNRIVGTPAYRSMTIRSWNTTAKLMELLDAAEEAG
jgi:uncharacterized protein (DUF1697 family)